MTLMMMKSGIDVYRKSLNPYFLFSFLVLTICDSLTLSLSLSLFMCLSLTSFSISSSLLSSILVPNFFMCPPLPSLPYLVVVLAT